MGIRNRIKDFNESKDFRVVFLREIIYVIAVIAIVSSVSYITLGRWSPMVAVESESMVPHMQIGDIIFIQDIDRTGIITYETGKETGYTSFEDYGNVILYRPYGKEGITPTIHRAMYYVRKGEDMWPEGPAAPFAGYITKGDNMKTNPIYDQQGSVSYNQPVKKEWIIGVARFHRVPVLGYVKLASKKIMSILLS